MHRTLLIRRDAAACRDAYERESRAAWSAALDVVLEKHGFLDLEVAGPERLRDPATWDEPRAVLVTSLPEDAWTPAAVEAAVGGRAQVLVEGPLPPVVRTALGIGGAIPAPRGGGLRVRSPELTAAAERYGYAPGGSISPPSISDVEIPAERSWRAVGAPFGNRQAAVWQSAGWRAEQWVGVPQEAEVLATFTPFGAGKAGTMPAIVRRGAVTACCLELFAYLGRMHTSEPAELGEWRSVGRTLPIEVMVLGLIDGMLARAGQDRVRVLPWPQHAGWVLSVRHDVDRTPTAADIRAQLARHSAAGTRATWYWRARHLAGPGGAGTVRLVADAPGHEVALHTEQLFTAAATDELQRLAQAAGRPIEGTSAHGDAECFRYQGAPNVLWAYHAGLLYTELIQHAHMHPHRFVALAADGTVRPLDIVCLPHHESFDHGTGPGEHRAEVIEERFPLYRRAGGLMQVLNHPDVHHDELFATLAKAPQEDVLDLSAADAARWWRSTHVRGRLTVEADGGRTLVSSQDGVSRAVLETLAPDGSVRTGVVSLPAGESVQL